MGKDFEISDKIKNYIDKLSKKLHPVQKEIIAYNETLGKLKRMQIAVSQCHFLELITKTSAKGSNKDRNNLNNNDFLNTITNKTDHLVTNAGFIRDGLTIKTYTQRKKGFGYFYAKRKVLDDGVSTTHLDI